MPNFRLFTASHVVAMTGAWMQRIAQDWLVFELSGSVTAVGITVALQFAPMLLFGLWGGVIVDRYSKRMLLMLCQGIIGVLSVVLAVLALVGLVEVWHVWVIAFAVGMVIVIENPTRQVFVNELVGPRHLRNAISVNAAVFQVGGLIGPAVAGILLVTAGAGWAFIANAIACLVTVLALAVLRTSSLVRAKPMPRTKGQLQQGVAYVIRKPAIFWSVVMLAVLSVFALTTPVILAAYATEVFDVGAAGYGLFNALIAGGALIGAISSTRRTGVRLRTVIFTGGLWGVLQAAAGFAPTELSFGIMLVALGVANLLFITAANALVQLSSNIGIRGRVMSVYVMVLLGGQSIGGPLMGWVVETWGAQAGMAISGLVPAIAAVLIGIRLARRGQLTLRVHVRRYAPVFTIVRRIDGGLPG